MGDSLRVVSGIVRGRAGEGRGEVRRIDIVNQSRGRVAVVCVVTEVRRREEKGIFRGAQVLWRFSMAGWFCIRTWIMRRI